MFDALKNLGNLGEMMKQARQMQEKMAALQDELARKQIVADAGAGMVEATVNGKQELMKLKIDKQKIDVNDTEMLEAMVVSAVKAAQAKAQEMMKQEMQKTAGDMGIPPGLLP
jgi:DNA-binding YbaB/EbfC family protein